MRHYVTKELPATTKEVLEKTTCDICDCEIREHMFEVDRVELSHRRGASYPEGSWGEGLEVDMCGSCFTTKLTPWLEAQGVDPTLTEWDY